jgi:hypothetical protein
MRRLLLVLLMLILPTQWTWAAAASYCQHESGSSHSQHLGHHEHRHTELKTDQAAADAQDLQQAGEHADCPSCHGAGSAPLMQAPLSAHTADPARVATPYQRAVTDGIPERLIRPPHRFLA